MKGGVLEINWHDSLPVLTLDFHPKAGYLATGGGDHDIKIWLLSPCQLQGKTPTASYKSSLSYHSTPVNVLRFSPSGDHLASGSDGGELALWKLHSEDGESWKIVKRLLHHQKDVLDLQWSADGAFLVSGSVDNTCIVWDAQKGSMHQIFDAHSHYVQGVSWDPLGHYFASVSSDRTCRIYMKQLNKSKGQQKASYACHHVISRMESIKADDSKAPNKFHLFHDETLPSFFRRLAWSPDGSFLVVPAGVHKVSSTSEAINTAYIFSRKDFSRPAVLLPAANKPIVAVRFCPIMFQLRGSESGSGFFKLPYRVVFAVATLNSLFVYDTESSPPIAVFAGLHLASITDIAWSSDARYLAVSSRDCYCTIVEFEHNELGTPISVPDPDKVPEQTSSPSPTQPELEGPTNMDVDHREIITNPTADKKSEEDKLPMAPAPSINLTNVKPKKRITPIAIS